MKIPAVCDGGFIKIVIILLLLNKYMKDNFYTIIVFFKSKPRKEQMLKEFLISIIDIALQNSGCIKHDLLQSVTDPEIFMFYENWVNKEAHEQHIARSEVQKWRVTLNDFLAKPYEVLVLETN